MSSFGNGKAPWVVDVKGNPGRSFEISVLREDNVHGKISYGWTGYNKKHIAGSGGPCRYTVSESVFDALIEVACAEAARLNAEEANT